MEGMSEVKAPPDLDELERPHVVRRQAVGRGSADAAGEKECEAGESQREADGHEEVSPDARLTP
jgi:hypothetical protein